MRLLLDEMVPAVLAEQLRDGGHDLAAVCERLALRGRSDGDVFNAAQEEGRAVATENVPDYRALAREWEASGRVHHGVVFTTNRQYPRYRPTTIGRLTKTLSRLLEAEADPTGPSNREIWL